LSAFERTLI